MEAERGVVDCRFGVAAPADGLRGGADSSLVLFHALVGFDVDHLHEVVESVEGGGIGDVINEQEGVAFEVGRGPEPAVFFLAGGVGKGEEIWEAVDCAGYGVGVLYGNGLEGCAALERVEERYLSLGRIRVSIGCVPGGG